MKKTDALLLITLFVCCIPTFECFAPHNKKKAVPTIEEKSVQQQQQQPAPAPQSLKETEAFKYLRSAISEASASWGLLTWSKHAAILNLLRQKQLQAAISDPTQRTRKEHDLDWAIHECMNPTNNGDLSEMFMRCADQGIKINESSLHAALAYTQAELGREFLALKATQNESFGRIKKMKALQRLVKHMQSLTIQDDDSDVDDYDEQHMFDKTRAITIQPQVTTSISSPVPVTAPAPTTPVTTTPPVVSEQKTPLIAS